MSKDLKKALNYSFLLLRYRARAKEELTKRLKIKEYSSGIIRETLTYLEKNGYIDDEKFAQLFVSCYLDKGWKPRRINFKLKELGVAEELIKKIFKKCGLDTDNYYEYE